MWCKRRWVPFSAAIWHLGFGCFIHAEQHVSLNSAEAWFAGLAHVGDLSKYSLLKGFGGIRAFGISVLACSSHMGPEEAA